MRYSIITISRQYGSGGREIGTQLADRLGIPFYDKVLCEEAAKRSGLDPTFLELAERREGCKLAYQLQLPGAPFRLSLDDQAFLALAARHPEAGGAGTLHSGGPGRKPNPVRPEGCAARLPLRGQTDPSEADR